MGEPLLVSFHFILFMHAENNCLRPLLLSLVIAHLTLARRLCLYRRERQKVGCLDFVMFYVILPDHQRQYEIPG